MFSACAWRSAAIAPPIPTPPPVTFCDVLALCEQTHTRLLADLSADDTAAS